MNNDILLSVVMPTYNRVKFLETAVSCFISQIIDGAFEDRIEIVIGNNASSDGTRDYINKLEAKYKFVRTINHSSNLGISGNIEKLIDMARGQYIWLFGDDDLIAAGALKRVLNSLEANNPNYIVINTSNIVSLDDNNTKYEIIDANRLGIKEDIFINNLAADGPKLSRAKDWLYLTNLLSAVAFKKKLFLDQVAKAKEYVRQENVYLFQAPIIMGIAESGRLNIVAECLVLHRKNETQWSESAQGMFTVSLYDSAEISSVIKDYIPNEYENYKKRFAAYAFGVIVAAKEKGVNVNKYIIDAFKENFKVYPYNIRFLITLFTPGIVFKLRGRLFGREKA